MLYEVITVDGKEQRGFEVYVGGGLGAVPYQAKLFHEFVPEKELLASAVDMGAELVGAAPAFYANPKESIDRNNFV